MVHPGFRVLPGEGGLGLQREAHACADWMDHTSLRSTMKPPWVAGDDLENFSLGDFSWIRLHRDHRDGWDVARKGSDIPSREAGPQCVERSLPQGPIWVLRDDTKAVYLEIRGQGPSLIYTTPRVERKTGPPSASRSLSFFL